MFLDSMQLYWTMVFFVFGLVVGSFVNVIIYRWPRQESIIWPASHCPHCLSPIRVMDNIPVISYLVLRGRCRHCHNRISPIYPIVELLVAFCFMAVVLKFGFSLVLIPVLLFVSALIAVSFIDLHVQLIPDRITFPLIVLGLLGSGLQSLIGKIEFWPITFIPALIGCATGMFILLAILFSYKLIMGVEGMGMGDVKLLGLIGLYLGWHKVILTLILASFVGTIIAVPVFLIKGKTRSEKIPFGPFLSIAALLSLFYGDFLVQLYLRITALDDLSMTLP
ncbi:prepilin peptidase [bacterium]|nr:prepilin peptidase [bacterium]